jgi:hypothetical protein
LHPLEAPSLAWRTKVSGREIVEQHIEADVEQLAPPAYQMIE